MATLEQGTIMGFANPSERANLRAYIEDLYRPEYVQRAWIDGKMMKGDFPLDDVIHFFFDDTEYAKKAHEYIGESLYDDAEVLAVQRVVAALDMLLDATADRDMTDADYVRTPEWPPVHDAAKALHALVVANDARMAAK